MIADHDRSYYIGASDTSYVVGNWKTKTFEKWWRVKQGFDRNDFVNDAMITGTYLEHRILDAVGEMEHDRQIIKGRLRVNLDGSTETQIYECKTYKLDRGFTVSKRYREQVQVEMYGTGFREAYIVAYGLTDADYKNFYLDIDIERVSLYPIPYDEEWVNEVYLPRFTYLAECLEEGKFPNENEWNERQSHHLAGESATQTG